VGIFLTFPLLPLAFGSAKKISPQRHGEHRENREKEDLISPSLVPLCDSLWLFLFFLGMIHFPFELR
jgi:hypothetical protein